MTGTLSWWDAAGRSQYYVENLYRTPSVVATIALGTALALLAAAVVPSRRVLTALTGTSLAVVLGVTVVPSGGWGSLAVAPNALHSIAVNVRPTAGDLTAWITSTDGPLNVVLFVPLGFFLALFLRRPLPAAAAAVLLSLVIECYQASLSTRVGAFPDIVANGVGAVVGATAAALVLALAPTARDRTAGARVYR
jgi:hypothetical protein